MKILFIVNPYSGTNNWEKVVKDIRLTWGATVHEFDIETLWQSEQGIEMARQAADDKYDMVIAVGGDATLNEIAGGLLGSETALGVIPAGKGNGFASHFGVPLSPKKSVGLLLNPEFRKMDVGEVNGRIFLVSVGVAVNAGVSGIFHSNPRKGLWSIVTANLKGLIPPPVQVKMVENKLEVAPLLITVTNISRLSKGTIIAPDANPFDGNLDLCIIERTNPYYTLSIVPRFLIGLMKKIPDATYIKIKEVSLFTQSKEPIYIDGTLIDPATELKIKIKPAALKIALGKNHE